jgi:hypothetical protein
LLASVVVDEANRLPPVRVIPFDVVPNPLHPVSLARRVTAVLADPPFVRGVAKVSDPAAVHVMAPLN